MLSFASPFLIQVLQIIFVVLFLDTPGHSINTSDMYPIPNTLEYGNRTYKIINANMTWYTALKTCLMHGAELVSITDQYHQSFLTVILNRLGHAHWIGLFTEDVGVLKSLDNPCIIKFHIYLLSDIATEISTGKKKAMK